MRAIPDDPIIRSMERRGLPPWIKEERGGAWGGRSGEEDEDGKDQA